MLDLSTGQSLVLLALVDHADAEGVSFPAQETLAFETGMQRSGVRKALTALIEQDVIELVEAGGPRRAARYRVAASVVLRATG